MTLHHQLRLHSLAAQKDRRWPRPALDRRVARHRWEAPFCSLCGGHEVLGAGAALVPCPECRVARTKGCGVKRVR